MGINEWTVIVAAIVVLVGSVWNLIANSKQTKSLDDNSKERHGSRKTEHGSLSTEHGSLSTEHAGISEKISDVRALASHLWEKAISDEAVKRTLPKQELNLTEMLNHMTAIIEDNAQLRQEIQQLKQRNQSLLTAISMHSVQDDEPEIDYT